MLVMAPAGVSARSARQIPGLNVKPMSPEKFPSTWATRPDRKSTRLNSSHLVISYAVFCLKKKKKPYGSRKFSLLIFIGGLNKPTTGQSKTYGNRVSGQHGDAMTRMVRDKSGFIIAFVRLL